MGTWAPWQSIAVRVKGGKRTRLLLASMLLMVSGVGFTAIGSRERAATPRSVRCATLPGAGDRDPASLPPQANQMWDFNEEGVQ
jgi:hypothetical protein